MTDTIATRTARRRMTHAAFTAEGKRRFGEDPKQWYFRCTNCGRPQKAADLPGTRCADVAQACWGCGRLVDEAKGDERAQLLRITQPDGVTKTDSFPFADELNTPRPAQGPEAAVIVAGGTEGPERADSAPAPASAPSRALSVERQTPGPREIPDTGAWGEGGEGLDPENWDYRVALGDEQAVLGYRGVSGLTVLFVDTAAWMCDVFHELVPDHDVALRHIAAYDRPITEADLEAAHQLVVDAHAEDAAAQASTELIPVQVNEAAGTYWTAEQGWLQHASDLAIDCSCHLSAPCSRCESLTPCEHCPTEVLVPGDDMDTHLAAIHPEIAESEV